MNNIFWNFHPLYYSDPISSDFQVFTFYYIINLFIYLSVYTDSRNINFKLINNTTYEVNQLKEF